VLSIDIRDARLADMDALRSVFRRASLSNEGDRAMLLAHPEILVFPDTNVREQRTRVAVIEQRIVGFASTVVIPGALEVDDLFVDPDWMRRGVGRALMHDVQEVARARALRRVEVSGNRHALAFYTEVGFSIDAEVAVEFGTALRMHLDVPL
jgi:GNAT superfamily N-acetyltransferase